MGINTDLLYSYPVIDPYTGASSIPKYQTSTFHQTISGESQQEFTYSRFGNPTVQALEEGIKKIENSKYALVFSSGMAAISNVLMLLKSGDHVIFPMEVYGGTCQFATEILPSYGIETSFIDVSSMNILRKEIKQNTKMVYIETPSNPLLKISNIKSIVQISKENQLVTVADNTFMTALYQKPLHLGVDMVVESITKFINGHSDTTGGFIATNNVALYKRLNLFQKSFGSILGVEDAWLILRGMKTMGIRMEKATYNSKIIAEFLDKHKKIEKVYYPSLENNRNNTIHYQQATNGGAVLSFELIDKYCLEQFIKKINLPIYAVSLGGVESIVSHLATMSHACLSKKEREKQGISETLLRLSCGIEDVEDLLLDLNWI